MCIYQNSYMLMKKIIAIAVLLALLAGCKKENTPKIVELKGIAFTESSIILEKGGSRKLEVTFTPDDATNKTLTWSSNNPSVATVAEGIVTAAGAGDAVISAKAGLDCVAYCTVKVVVAATSVIVAPEEISLVLGETGTLKATVLPADATDAVVWSSSDESVATVDKGVVTALSVGKADITVICGEFSATCALSVVLPAGAVDLGIVMKREDGSTYKLYLAECNLSESGFVSSQEEFGGYFAWGETKVEYSSLNPLTWKEENEHHYYWTSYKWCKGTDNTLTKYNTNSEYGAVDNKTSFRDYDYEDDAARKILGGVWRTPSEAEWLELLAKCTWEWTSQNKVTGSKVTGPNGKTVFLPAAGHIDYDQLRNVQSYGEYLSSTLVTDNPRRSPKLYFDLYGNHRMFTSYRSSGFSVRPVCGN